jgi:HD-like signal output (HDOD) protein
VVRLLEKDQMLAGAVMRLVGSPLYAGRGPVRSLADAVLRLGIRTVRDTVFEAAIKKSMASTPLPELAGSRGGFGLSSTP